MVDRLDEPHATDLKKVICIAYLTAKTLYDAQYQTEVAVDQLLARLFVAFFCTFEQLRFFFGGKNLEARRIDSAKIDFIIIHS